MTDNSTLPKWHHRHEPKYLPANDNRPQDESGQSAGFEVVDIRNYGARGSVVGDRGLYIGLTRQQTHEKFRADVEKWRADDTPTYRQQQGLEALAEMPGFVYLGSPYAKYPAGLTEANRVVSTVAGILMKRGLRIYCPIAHGHAVSSCEELPRDWDFWKSQDQPLIDAAAAIVVLEMRGWHSSVGLTYEIECFMKAGKPILYIEPSALGVEEPEL